MTKAATYKLKMAPISAPSVTAMPTVRPPSTTRSQGRRADGFASAARAKKIMPTVMGYDATPQHAVEKKPECRAAAKPPKMQAGGGGPDCRKTNHDRQRTRTHASR